MTDGEVTWLKEADGTVGIGVRVINRGSSRFVEFLSPDGETLGFVREENIAQLMEKLRTGIAFVDLVGDSAFQIDLNDLT